MTFLRTIGGAIGVGLLGAALGWQLADRLSAAGGSRIDITAALRPETHESLAPADLALVQASLGLTLRDIYVMMTILAVGCLACASWLPDQQGTLDHSQTHERTPVEDETMAIAASEF